MEPTVLGNIKDIPQTKFRMILCTSVEETSLRNEELLKHFLYKTAEYCNCTPKKYFSYPFPDGGKGITAGLIVGESIIHLHSWPDRNYFDITAHVCSEEADLEYGLERAITEFFPEANIFAVYELRKVD